MRRAKRANLSLEILSESGLKIFHNNKIDLNADAENKITIDMKNAGCRENNTVRFASP